VDAREDGGDDDDDDDDDEWESDERSVEGDGDVEMQ